MRYKVTALKSVESYVDASDITVAGLMATIECNRDKVTLVSVEQYGESPVLPWTPPSFDGETTTDFELAQLDGHI